VCVCVCGGGLVTQASRTQRLGGRVSVRRVTREHVKNDVHTVTSARVPPAHMLTTNLSFSTQAQAQP
jgi:hypothetical protein